MNRCFRPVSVRRAIVWVSVSLSLATAACTSDQPNPVAPAGKPHLDNGVIIGSGNRLEVDSTATTGLMTVNKAPKAK